MMTQGGGTSLAGLSTRYGRRLRSSLARPATILAFAALLLGGCGVIGRQAPTGLPARHKFTANQLVVQSDIRLPKNHQLIQDLETLREDLASTLELPLQKQPVTIYLFADEVRYAQYLQTAYPNLPPRRAYFVGTSDELAVYTFWGDKIQEDLRHEYTHGVLHASLKDVPLWLDEGLAEYFEVHEGPRGYNREYAEHMGEALRNGWRPDMLRLEQLTEVQQMQKADYLEAWAWVHFMLHDSDDTRGALLSYIADLRFEDRPQALSARLQNTLPNTESRFLAHASTLSQAAVTAGAVKVRQ
jgi:Protein of unknown function (DUF1570)